MTISKSYPAWVIGKPWSSPLGPSQLHVMVGRVDSGLGRMACGVVQVDRGEPWKFIDPENLYQHGLVAEAVECEVCRVWADENELVEP